MFPGDPKHHWEKAYAMLDIVDLALGITSGPLRQPTSSEVFLSIKDKRVIGCLFAEPILTSDKLSKSFLKDQARVIRDESVERSQLVGVSRIWVHPDFQRKGIATKLMDALRFGFRLPVVVPKDQLVLSHTSEMGAKFAEKYFGKVEFLVYTPA